MDHPQQAHLHHHPHRLRLLAPFDDVMLIEQLNSVAEVIASGWRGQVRLTRPQPAVEGSSAIE
jgi:hypothetical protein